MISSFCRELLEDVLSQFTALTDGVLSLHTCIFANSCVRLLWEYRDISWFYVYFQRTPSGVGRLSVDERISHLIDMVAVRFYSAILLRCDLRKQRRLAAWTEGELRSQ